MLTREQIVTIEVLQQRGQSQSQTARILGVSEGVLGGMYSRYLPPGTENLAAVLIMAVAVMYAGTKRRHLAHLQT